MLRRRARGAEAGPRPDAPPRPRPERGPGALTATGRFRARWWWLLFAVALLAAGAWYALHPAPLPRGGDVVATTPAGAPVHLGVLRADRELELRSVQWDEAVLGEDDDVSALVCREGSVGVTRDLAAFCSDVVPARGTTLQPGDQLVLRVSAAQPGVLRLGGVRIAWRDGLQWGEQVAGPDLEVEVTGS